jgi:integrase
MTPRRRKSRLYARLRGGARRYYVDARDYADVGGKQEALVAPGEKLATTDRDVAEALAAARIKELDAMRRGRGLHGRARSTPLAEYAASHLEKKARAGRVTVGWLEQHELYLRRAADFFGADRGLETIRVPDVQAYVVHLTELRPLLRRQTDSDCTPRRRAKPLTSGTIRHHLNVLSHLFLRAQSEDLVAPGFNPVGAMLDKPSGVRREAAWLEVHDAALLLESARTLPPMPEQPHILSAPFAHALLATFLLTGARRAEVFGLEVEDVSFDRQTVTIRPNDWRRLKTLKAARVVPLWPQLAEILQPFVFSRPPSRLLFPSFVTGKEAMLVEWRRTLDRIAVRAGWKKGEVRTKAFRHTYCAQRLQTLDNGAPVSPYTVSRELGHGSLKMVEEVYSHLGTVRHRAEVVEYRIEQHAVKLGDRLTALSVSHS